MIEDVKAELKGRLGIQVKCYYPFKGAVADRKSWMKS